jgi:hypothetical protein
MTAERAEAYGQATRLLNAMAGVKLHTMELELLREVADVCVFAQAGDLGDVDTALSCAAGVLQDLVDSDRWIVDTAQLLLNALETSAGYHAHRGLAAAATA